jgi:erythromycin esterase
MRRSADDALVSSEGIARFREAEGKSKAADNNIRDQRMAENLIWLANERYKGRRIIVWAAIFHALYDPSAIKVGPDDSFSFQGVLTMGHVVRKSLGNQIYTVGFTAAGGGVGDVMGGRRLALPKPAKGSFEDLCMRVGRRFLFVDFRGLSVTHWLRSPISARPFDHSPIVTDWTRQMDALVFTDVMFPSTKDYLAPAGAVLVDHPTSRRPRE